MPNEKILIVDDEVDVLDLCKRILATQGYHIDSAHNGFEAIAIAKQKPLDLLLTDIKMPGMSGLEITQQIKEIDSSIVCVTMTGFSTMDMAINALKLGIDEFILKPFTPKELSAAVSKALEKERLRKENVRLRSLIPLFEFNKTLVGTVEEAPLLQKVLTIAQEETNASFAAVYMTTNNTAYFHAQNETTSDAVKTAGFELAREFTGIESTKQIEADSPEYQAAMEAMGITAAIVAPLKSQNSSMGIIMLGLHQNTFAPSDSEFLSVLSGQAGTALENARLFTDKQEAYEQLRDLDRMKSEFINIAAHELRTPLAILMGYAAVLEEDAPSSGLPYISNITRNAIRLRSLIDDMLDLNYLKTGIPVLSQDRVNLRQVAEQITQDVSLLVEEKQVNITLDIDPDIPEMIVDRQKLDLILVNLIHNAVKFTAAGGSITIMGRIQEKLVAVAVHNTGSFIPKSKQNEIFEPFSQLEPSLTREHGGAGLGLAIVRGMVEVCGGSVAVKSSEEAGTTFNFDLPVDNSHVEARRLKIERTTR
jgi:signal transduction histidine kinase